jgi:hypothetical protein
VAATLQTDCNALRKRKQTNLELCGERSESDNSVLLYGVLEINWRDKMKCKNCGEEIINDDHNSVDKREFCDLQCDLYHNSVDGYFHWVEWQEMNNVGFVAKFNN